MPLSNLLLIFCPSLAMSPPLLRLLCEGEGIWDGPIKAEVLVEEDSNSGEDGSVDSDMEDSNTQDENDAGDDAEQPTSSGKQDTDIVSSSSEEHRKARPRSRINVGRARVATIYLPTSPRDVQPRFVSDTLSAAGASDDRHASQKLTSPSTGRMPLDASNSFNSSLSTPYSPPPLTSDSDSLGTPASLNTDDTPSEGEHGQTTTALGTAVPPPTPRVQSDLPSPRKIRKSSIGNPVVFPPVAGSAPVTPVEFLPALRLSSYSSSSPELGPDDSPRRKSKVSLQDLLPKRSLSSLLGRSPATPDSSRSFSTPPSQTRISATPPVLDFSLNQSPIKLDMDFAESEFSSGHSNEDEFSKVKSFGNGKSVPRLDVPSFSNSNSQDSDPMKSAVSTSSTSSGMFYTPPTSYRQLTHAHSEASLNSTGSYSLLEFGFNKETLGDGIDDSDDWAKSVLIAARTDSKSGQ